MNVMADIDDDEDEQFRKKEACIAAWSATMLKEAEEMFVMAKRFADGDGIEKNAQYSTLAYKKAADMGHVEAALMTAKNYQIGYGVPKDDICIFSYYLIAALRGHADSQLLMGDIYSKGRIVPHNLESAKEWYEKAAENGMAVARRKLDFITQNEKKSAELEFDGEFVTIKNTYIPGFEKVQGIANLVDYALHSPVIAGNIIFVSRLAVTEALFFIFSVVVKYLEDVHNFKKIEPCYYVLSYCFEQFGMKQDVVSLVHQWKSDRLPFYRSRHYSEYAAYTDDYAELDYEEWIRGFLNQIMYTDSTALSIQAFRPYEMMYSMGGIPQCALKLWYIHMMHIGIFHAISVLIVELDQMISKEG